MKKKLSVIIIVIFIIIVAIILYTFIKNSDDFVPYISKEYDKVYDIHSDIYNLLEIKSELTEIAQEYEEGLKLTFVQYDIEENNKKAEFQFYKNDYDGQNKACLLTINIDIDAKKTTKIKYEKGHGKRVSGYSNEISTLEKVSDYINSNESIKIIVTIEDITLYKDEQKIEKKDFIKNITNNIGEDFNNYNGVITEINSNNIVFENQSNNKKYLIDVNSDFKFINGRTNEEMNFDDIKVGYDDLLSDYNIDSGKFEMKVEINSNTVIECKGGINKIEQLEDVALDIIKIKLDKDTINNEVPIATYFRSSNGN